MIAGLILLLGISAPMLAADQSAADQSLRLLISVEQLTIAGQDPARATLHLHNAGKQPIWLYRRVRDKAEQGSTLEVRLEPLDAKPGQLSLAAGRALESAGLPRPKLVKLEPGGDTTEKVTLKLLPAKADTEGKATSLWGRYRLTVNYGVHYANAAYIAHETGAVLWQGETLSNSVEIELRPPAGNGSVSGSVANAQGQTLSNVIVSLSDGNERLMDQVLTDSEGRYSFGGLPPGTYWVTVRRPNFTENTAVFRSTTLTAESPSGTIEFALYPPETYEPRDIVHKPVILLVTDSEGHAVDKVSYESVWSSGQVLDTAKGEVSDDGTATFEAIPGRSYVTLKRPGCGKTEHRIDVAKGEGVDGFKLALDCAKR